MSERLYRRRGRTTLRLVGAWAVGAAPVPGALGGAKRAHLRTRVSSHIQAPVIRVSTGLTRDLRVFDQGSVVMTELGGGLRLETCARNPALSFQTLTWAFRAPSLGLTARSQSARPYYDSSQPRQGSLKKKRFRR
eukprot:767896-Hanusia_phi.AAC.1